MQTVQIKIRLLLEEQSDLNLHCLPFHLHLFDDLCKIDEKANCSNCSIFRTVTIIVLGALIFQFYDITDIQY